MSEEQFEFYSDEDLIGVLDTVTGRTFNSFEIVALLNEQQDKIQELEEKNEQLQKWNEHYKKELIKPIDLANLKYKHLVGRPVMRFTEEQKKELLNKFEKLEKGDG